MEVAQDPTRPAFAEASAGRPPFQGSARTIGYACFSGVRTISPSSSSLTLIWQDSREFGRTS